MRWTCTLWVLRHQQSSLTSQGALIERLLAVKQHSMQSKTVETRKVVEIDDIARHNGSVNSTTYSAAVSMKLVRAHDIFPRRDTHVPQTLIWSQASDSARRAYWAQWRQAEGKLPDRPPWHEHISKEYGKGSNALNAEWFETHKLPDLPKPVAESSTSVVAAPAQQQQLNVDFGHLSVTPSPQPSPKTPSPGSKGQASPSPNWSEEDELRSDLD